LVSQILIVALALAACLIHRQLFRRATGLGRLFGFADRFPFGVVVYGADLTIRFANRYARNIYGKPLQEIIGRRDCDLLTEDAVSLLAGELHDALADGQVRSAETRLETGGQRQMFLMTFGAVEGSDTGERELVSIWFETSKIDELGERLSRLNRTLATHIEANRVLIACESERDLRDRFCEALCRHGGYELAWIGARSPDGSVVPIAAAGCDRGELEGLQIRWDDAAESSLPVARALSENKPFRASSHTAVEKQLGDLLADRKLQSCAGLPICVAGAPEYALCVCSQQQDAFDEEEMRHLVQLANDAGFATESLRNREHLKQSRESLAEAQRIARLGTWRYQLDTGSFQWSSETYRIHAWPRESPLSLGALESLVYPEDRPRVVAAVHTLLREAGSMEIEYRLLLPNQEVRHLHVCAKALSDDDRQVFALTGTVLDVTDQKGRDDKDRAIEKMLVSFLDNLPAVVTLKDEHLEHVYGNTAALDVFHMKSEQFVGTTDTTFLTRDTADLLHVVERSVLNTRQPVLTPEIPLGTNGERRTLRGLCFPVLLPGGRILVGMYASDITELQTVTAKTGLLESALEAASSPTKEASSSG
jgi:PAS domain-containing protein